VSAALTAALAAGAAVLLLPERAGRARARLRRPPPATAVVPADTPAEAVAGLADRLAGVARAGLPPGRVWAVLADRPGPHTVLAHQVLPWLAAGVPAGRGLGAVAARGPGVAPADLRCLAVALDACERSGAPLGPALDGLATALRAQDEARRDRETALAAPRATAAVMTALPGIGLLLGAALGADPLAVLAGTTPGRVALVLGAASWAGGRWWIHRLVAVAEAAGERASPVGTPR
jgi:tight adherence protein B